MISQTFRLAVFLVLLSAVPVYAQERSVLDQQFVFGNFRIFYTTTGPSAIPDDDIDSSGVPDRVEDIAKQMSATHKLFCGAFGYIDPLNCERYAGVNCIQVSIRNRREGDIGNGKSYDEAERARKTPEGRTDDRALMVAIGSHIDAKANITPSHETFHLIQYASTYFKNRWFLEGQARWAEHALGADGMGEFKYSSRGPWPQAEKYLPVLFEQTYGAEYTLWNPIAVATDSTGILPRSKELREIASMRYSDGQPILRDMNLNGIKVMRDILEELDRMDDIAFKKLGYQSWTEENQRSDSNSRFAYEAVMNALRRHNRRVGPFSAQ